ncbi:ABC-2 type transport system ATP-binding protein [Paenibacillus sp. UNCCL117]|uniref:ABC transporter ATP-binding protein n=1 Tax=unclassified Paenibacillus TaxID=185978 RepID=UPI00087FCD0B|nr:MULTISPECIES: ABC transporter ATP-binding protein [unclassified Paenibacillus]SDC94152.1 ABC-2 type transport system ATP-binding protein [Paenibacillus sp. cl123]SFW29745.1 ABC-2 type transport system ATP-binding protein [Paenibacillus sp. UNCCL117]
MMMIDTDELTKTYSGRGGCRGISLQVPEGCIFGLLGPNGAGKSTFVKMLAGLHRPDSGRAAVLGLPLGQPAARRRLGYLPELFRFQDWLTPNEVLRFHGRLGGLRPQETRAPAFRSRVRDCLELVGLAEAADRRVGGFSKGMQQRLGLAAALLLEPELIILDEPSSALDPVGRYEIRSLLKRLRGKGVTIFLNTHLLEDVEELCDEAAFLYGGELLASGPLHELLLSGAGGGAGGEANWRFRVGGWLPETWAELNDAVASALSSALQLVEADEQGNALLTARVADREQAGYLCSLFIRSGLTLYESAPQTHSLETWFLRMAGSRHGGVAP